MRSMRSMLPLSRLSLSIQSIITARMASRYLISTKINESLRQSIVSQLFARTCQSASSEHLHSSFIYLLQKIILWRSLVHKFTLFFLGFFCIVSKNHSRSHPLESIQFTFPIPLQSIPAFFSCCSIVSLSISSPSSTHPAPSYVTLTLPRRFLNGRIQWRKASPAFLRHIVGHCQYQRAPQPLATFLDVYPILVWHRTGRLTTTRWASRRSLKDFIKPVHFYLT